MEENLQYSWLNLDFIMAEFVIRLETQQKLLFDNLLKIAGNENRCKNGHFKLQIPSQVCRCVCLDWKAAILLNFTIKSQTEEYLQQMLFESNGLFYQELKCSTLPSLLLKLLSD